MSNKWEVKLLDVFYDVGVCIAGCNLFCCCMQAEAVHRVTNSGRCIPYCWVLCCCFMGRLINRRKIQRSLKISPSDYDCCISCYCMPCSQCQEYNEVFKRYPPQV